MTGSHNAAYGFRLSGVSGETLAVYDAERWPILSVLQRLVSDPGLPETHVDGDRASIQTPAAYLTLTRESWSVEICSPEPLPAADIVHPALWPAAAVFARWHGRETLHAGAFSLDGKGAWAVLGERGAGKSSLLSALVMRGVEVLADDLLVVDGLHCFAGPRCIDLRQAAATALGVSGQTSVVRSTERRRLKLAPCRGSYQLRGFVYLAWGSETQVDRLTPAESFGLLVNHRRVAALGADFEHLLDLAALPAMRLTRPVDWTGLDGVLTALTQSVCHLDEPRSQGYPLRPFSHSNLAATA